MHSPCILELGNINNPKDTYIKQKHLSKMVDSFLSNLDGEILSLGSGFWPK